MPRLFAKATAGFCAIVSSVLSIDLLSLELLSVEATHSTCFVGIKRARIGSLQQRHNRDSPSLYTESFKFMLGFGATTTNQAYA